METIHEHHYYLVKHHGPGRVKSFRSINCRTAGSSCILPTPERSKSTSFYSDLIVNMKKEKPGLWAGPAYSNSPPPSSLPIPKRTVSLELPPTQHTIAKSAPSSHGFPLFNNADDSGSASHSQP